MTNVVRTPENVNLFAPILSALEIKGPVRRQGKGFLAHCPNPVHADQHPSFVLFPWGGGRCYSQCGRYWSASEIAELIGIRPIEEFSRREITIPEMAIACNVPVEFLRNLGWKEVRRKNQQCISIPYSLEDGSVVATRIRASLDGPNRFFWDKGAKISPYGLSRLSVARQAGYIVLVEGETDTVILWHRDIPALGIPGVATWRSEWASYVTDIPKVYIWQEPDKGGDSFIERIGRDIPNIRVVPTRWGKRPA